MSTQLSKLFTEVKEQNLSKEKLEDYHSELSRLFALMHMEMAGLEKAEAVYLAESQEEKAINATRAWNAGEKGQRMIEIKHYIRATEKILSSLKNRIYSLL